MRRCRQLPRARFRRNAWIWSCDDELRIAWCRDTRSTMRLAGDANPAALQARARHVRTAARNDAPPPSSTARTTRPSASGPGWDALRRKQYSATGTRTRVARVRAKYPNQLDYSGFWQTEEKWFMRCLDATNRKKKCFLECLDAPLVSTRWESQSPSFDGIGQP